MTLELIQTLYDYNHWASEQIFAAAVGVTPEQLNAPGTAGHGSIRETMLHVVSAHRGWLSWWDGSMTAAESMQSNLDPADYPDLDSVRTVWEETMAQSRAFLDGLTEADLGRIYTATLPWDGQTVSFVLWEMMLHVANHGTQHRSEAAAMLTVFEHSPGLLDLINFLILRQAAAQR